MAPLFSLLVLSFGVLPALKSKLRCHNPRRGGGLAGGGRGRREAVEALQPSSEPPFASPLRLLVGTGPEMIMQARNMPLVFSFLAEHLGCWVCVLSS